MSPSVPAERHAVVRPGPPGSPLVVLEGSLAAPVELWAPFARELRAAVTTVASERPGVARSPRTWGRRTLPVLADELAELVARHDDTGTGAVVVGEGFGGLVALELARRHPERIAGLVLVDSPHPDALVLSARQRQAMARLELVLLRAGTAAVLGRPPAKDGYDHLPPADARTARKALSGARWTSWTALAELRAWKRSVPRHGPLPRLPGDPPVAVVSSADLLKGDPSYARLQSALVDVSTRARAVRLPGARPLLEVGTRQVLAEVTLGLAQPDAGGVDARTSTASTRNRT